MTKDGKSSATIRRRKIKYSHNDLERVKKIRPSSPTPLQEIHEFDETDEGYIFDDEVLGPSIVKKIMASEKTLLLALIALRVINGLLVQTSYVPDEFWQSLEPAHNMAFGYGYLTWEWRTGLRGYLYPLVFALPYKLLGILGLDNRLLLTKLPRMLQGVFAAYGDLYLYKLSWLLCDRATAQWTLFCQAVSWFMFYCSTRTLTNSSETALITIALFYYPWPSKHNTSQSVRKFLMFAALSVIVRPTAAVIWILLCSWHLQNSRKHLFRTLKTYIGVGILSLALSGVIDRLFYGDWTFVQYNFLKFNVLSGGGSMYGTHPWHWYLTQGYPAVMGLHLAPFVIGAWRAKNKVLLWVIIWMLISFSFLSSHKEFRFLMPILPLSFHYCGVYFQSLCRKPRLKKKLVRRAYANSKTDAMHGSQESLVSRDDESECTEISSDPSVVSTETSGIGSDTEAKCDGERDGSEEAVGESDTSPSDDVKTQGDTSIKEESLGKELDERVKKQDLSANEIIAVMEKKQKETHKRNLWKAKLFVIILLVTNIPVGLYFNLIHQRGTIYVMKYLHDSSQDKNIDVLYLMPCHSTPYYSYIHRNISMRFLQCEPNLHNDKNHVDEADDFFSDPLQWLKREYAGSSRPWPSHIVYFSPLKDGISMYLSQSGYRDCASYFHTHLPEGRVGTHVLVSCR